VSGCGVPTRKAAVLVVLRYYGRALLRHRGVAVPGLLLPALADTCLLYLVPLIVAQLAGRLAGRADTGAATVLPYVLSFVALMVVAEALWRVGVHCMNRTDGRGIEELYVIGFNELLAKDAAFFHDNFAGSLTKRVLSFAARFEDFADTLAFSAFW
jgi:ATP-binding cassette subfamily B protein